MRLIIEGINGWMMAQVSQRTTGQFELWLEVTEDRLTYEAWKGTEKYYEISRAKLNQVTRIVFAFFKKWI